MPPPLLLRCTAVLIHPCLPPRHAVSPGPDEAMHGARKRAKLKIRDKHFTVVCIISVSLCPIVLPSSQCHGATASPWPRRTFGVLPRDVVSQSELSVPPAKAPERASRSHSSLGRFWN